MDGIRSVTLVEMMNKMRKRSGCYLGSDRDVKSLAHFMDGFRSCKRMMGILTEYENKFSGSFREFILNEYADSYHFDEIETILPWDDIIRYIAPSDKDGIELFWELYDKFSDKVGTVPHDGQDGKMTAMTLDEILNKIRIRLGMWLGNDQDVKSLYHFIGGAYTCKQMMGILTEYEKKFSVSFWDFIFYEYEDIGLFEKIGAIQPWYKIIQYLAPADKEGIRLFWELYDKFIEKGGVQFRESEGE